MKNYRRMLEAYAALDPASRPSFRLIVPGCSTRLPTPKGVEITRQPLAGCELAELYRAAIALVVPSLRETFGLPILEAMACGCPVITSTDTGCSEVAGNAALLVDPRSVEDLSSAMRRIVGDGKLRRELRQKGFARAAEFSWKTAARLHLETFRKALGARPRSSPGLENR